VRGRGIKGAIVIIVVVVAVVIIFVFRGRAQRENIRVTRIITRVSGRVKFAREGLPVMYHEAVDGESVVGGGSAAA
jgi:hypothetical protein